MIPRYFGEPVPAPDQFATEPDGVADYSWLSAGKIDPSDSSLCPVCRVSYSGVTGGVWDWQHINAVQPYQDGYLVSFRNTSSVYYIDAATGNVVWKLGGTDDPGESLTIVGDPEGATDFGNQHDVRAWPDGSITVFDNGTRNFQPPRMLRFDIDAAAGTATLVQSISNPNLSFSPYCSHIARCRSRRRS